MAFVNEFASNENIKKYKLDELHRKWGGRFSPSDRFEWIFDAEREYFYIVVASGREEESNQKTGFLFMNGVLWETRVRVEPTGSKSFDERPYRKVWGLIYLKGSPEATPEHQTATDALKEALVAYRVSGVVTPDYLDVQTSFTF